MDTIYIEVQGGSIIHTYSTSYRLKYVIIDWDNIEAGDKLKFTKYSPDTVLSDQQIKSELKQDYNTFINKEE